MDKSEKLTREIERRMKTRMSIYKQEIHGGKKLVTYDVSKTVNAQGTVCYYPVVDGVIFANNHYTDPEDALMEARKMAVRKAS